mmetsp:Transcript_18307/g.38496  ORF Transcript_18307/g.38496 Transcript_18307/m.38496 type:complete len:640 (+) Transcript_18307:205-2124(+)
MAIQTERSPQKETSDTINFLSGQQISALSTFDKLSCTASDEDADCKKIEPENDDGPIYYCAYLRCADLVRSRTRSAASVRITSIPLAVTPQPVISQHQPVTPAAGTQNEDVTESLTNSNADKPSNDREQRRKAKKLVKKRRRQKGKRIPMKNSPTLIWTTSSFDCLESPPSLNKKSQLDSSKEKLQENSGGGTKLAASTITPLPSQFIIHVKPLIVLDLNGILCHRIRKNDITSPKCDIENITNSKISFRPSIGHVANTDIIPRSDLIPFLNYLNNHFSLAVWTSATRKTARSLVDLLFPPNVRHRLVFVWSRSFCNLVETASLESALNDVSVLGHKNREANTDDSNIEVVNQLANNEGKVDENLHDLSPSEAKKVKLEKAKQMEACTEHKIVLDGAFMGDEKNVFSPEDVNLSTGTINHFTTENGDTSVDCKHIASASKSNEIDDQVNKTTIAECSNINHTCNKDKTKNIKKRLRKSSKSTSTCHEGLTAIKSLGKVWMEFPLWNHSNTLLLDDSPEKCPKQFRGNALHPPSIRGTFSIPFGEAGGGDEKISDDRNAQDSQAPNDNAIDADDANQKAQQKFFELLAKHWEQPSPFHMGSDVRNTSASHSDELRSSSLELFLNENANVFNMGWEMSARI